MDDLPILADRARIETFELDQTLPGGFRMPTRMSAVPLPDGGVALVSAIPIDDTLARAIEALGEVRYILAPNLFHHLHVAQASRRYPEAVVLAPRRLREKRPDLRIDRTLDEPLPASLASAVEVVAIEGAPSLDEFAIFHRSSRTLIVTDLVFHVTDPRGWVANVVLFLVGCHGKLAQSRAWYGLSKDRVATARSLARLLELDFDTLVVAHGEPVRGDARAKLARALRIAPAKKMLLAAEGAR